MPPPAPVSSWARMLNSIRQNGFLGFHRQMLRMNDAKVGRLVGTDYIGNKYYENDNEHSGRNRWVDYGQEGGANTTYSTVAPKMLAWEPKITPRK